MARSSYQLRDDDNIYLGRIEAQLLAAVQEAKRRLQDQTDVQTPELLSQVLEETDFGSESRKSVIDSTARGYKLQARQLIGQPNGILGARAPRGEAYEYETERDRSRYPHDFTSQFTSHSEAQRRH